MSYKNYFIENITATMRRIHCSLKHRGCVFKTHPNKRPIIETGKLERGHHEGLAANGI
jgi:hypothetical protein